MKKPYRRIEAKSNTHAGKDFEIAAQVFFEEKGIPLYQNVKVPIGIRTTKKEHAFDLGSIEERTLVECKSHKWTRGGNVPSAKLTIWNEAMYYFLAAPDGYRKIMFVLRDYNEKRDETLAEYYLKKYRHLIPVDVEFWEYDEATKKAKQLSFNK
ncbi:hypothetical protein WCX49_07140 [Sulfurimonas sp. HSL-1656]|uniref:hypothetical protein n=1 Tax=Thiomicrolovo subterrani TaxID=3131934 RepID=UPI0031F9B61A